jgi:SAM-dependent methyltransferase
MPERSFDLVVLHSVSQYLSGAEFDRVVALFRRLLKPSGLFVLGDVVPHEVPAVSDAWALLRLAKANGFLLAALAGLVRTFFSDYWRLRSRIGLTRYSEAEIIARLAALGFTATRAPRNIGHIVSRMTFLARPTAG